MDCESKYANEQSEKAMKPGIEMLNIYLLNIKNVNLCLFI